MDWDQFAVFDPTIYHQAGNMADPLSIAASVVGIAVPALHGARLLLSDIQKILRRRYGTESSTYLRVGVAGLRDR